MTVLLLALSGLSILVVAAADFAGRDRLVGRGLSFSRGVVMWFVTLACVAVVLDAVALAIGLAS